ncbi:hypothetical protein [Streptomyces alanosinicus]
MSPRRRSPAHVCRECPNAYVQELDTDGDGQLSAEEFRKAVQRFYTS